MARFNNPLAVGMYEGQPGRRPRPTIGREAEGESRAKSRRKPALTQGESPFLHRSSLIEELAGLAHLSEENAAIDEAASRARQSGDLTEVVQLEKVKEMKKAETLRRMEQVKYNIKQVFIKQQELARNRQIKGLFTRAQLREHLEQHAPQHSESLFRWIEEQVLGHSETQATLAGRLDVKVNGTVAKINPQAMNAAVVTSRLRRFFFNKILAGTGITQAVRPALRKAA